MERKLFPCTRLMIGCLSNLINWMVFDFSKLLGMMLNYMLYPQVLFGGYGLYKVKDIRIGGITSGVMLLSVLFPPLFHLQLKHFPSVHHVLLTFFLLHFAIQLTLEWTWLLESNMTMLNSPSPSINFITTNKSVNSS